MTQPGRKRALASAAQDCGQNLKRERHESGDEGSTTASHDENNSCTDSDSPSREYFDEDAASLASIMISIANSCGRRPATSQPSSAETVVNMSASSSVTGDDNDDHSGDSTLVKKQRRREKNRASAQQSRQRKKHHLESLEIRVEELERDKAQLLAQVQALKAENKRLRGGSGPPPAAGDSDAELQVKSDEMMGAGLLNQLAQAAQKLRAMK
jgi:hypothetical protein